MVDNITINCCLNASFIIWYLYVLNSIMSYSAVHTVFNSLAERMAYFIMVRI